jgi:ACS family tartrate transporter-like MFS transporter
VNAQQQSVLRKASWHLLPFMFVLYVISYLDRINISFAAAPMMAELNFNSTTIGFAGGVFFIGYCIFGVPSNIALNKFGARKWISILMMVWGSISCLTVLTTNATILCANRLLLGVAEAGFFPGMILYLTYWFPRRERGMAVAKFMSAIPLSSIIGGIISSYLLKMHGIFGLAGWHWLFLLTGLPAVIMGIVVWFILPDGPHNAKWLCDHERETLADLLAADNASEGTSASGETVLAVFKDTRVWMFALIYFSLTTAMYGFTLWLPQIIASSFLAGSTNADSQAAMRSIVPAIFQALGMLVIARSSDKLNERRKHLSCAAMIGAIGFACASAGHDPIFLLVSLCLTAFGIWGAVGPFWAMPTSLLRALQAPAGIALINSVGNLGGFAGPTITGILRDNTRSFQSALIGMSVCLVLTAVLSLLAPKPRTEVAAVASVK